MSSTQTPTNFTPTRIAIVGAGGIGSNLCRGLFDFAIRRGQFRSLASAKVTVFDDDEVDEGNLLNQDFTDNDLGRLKAEVMSERYGFDAATRRATEEDLAQYECVFCCVDNMTFRRTLYKYTTEKKKSPLFFIDGRCTSAQGAVFNSDMAKEELFKYIDDSDKSGGCLFAREKAAKVSFTTPVVVANIMVQAFLNKHRNAPNFPIHVTI